MEKDKLITQIIDHTKGFQKLVLANWEHVNDEILSLVTKEYLTLLMYCVIFMFQSNDLSNTELDNFTKAFYKKVVDAGLLKEDELLDYEKLSRERYMDFYQILSEGKGQDQLEGKRLNALIAKEVLYIQKLLSEFGEKENALGELYPELFSANQALKLQVQLMFIEKG